MVAGDDVVGRGDGVLWARHESDLAFSMPQHQHGKIRIAVPAEMQAEGSKGDREASVTSVMLYKSTAPASGREVVAISAATDLATQLAMSDEPQGEQDQKVAKGQ
jgi:hypothetical protein